ncbi:MAG: hypothetical protein ACOY4I_08310 [Bacillota bacterium]
MEDWVWERCQCRKQGYTILDRWVEYPNQAETLSSSQALFNLNKPKEMDGENGEAGIKSISIYGDRNDPRYPSVAVRAQGKMKTIWMNFMNKLDPSVDLSSLRSEKCGQSESFYVDLRGKYIRVARDACR